MRNRTARPIRELARLSLALSTPPGQPIERWRFKALVRDLKTQWNRTPRPKRGATMLQVERAIVRYREAIEQRNAELQGAKA
jgi:hypothetical protein